MRGLMMDVPLTTTAILRHAERMHASQQIVSLTADHPSPADPWRYSFADLAARTRRLANALCRKGLRQGDRVATLAWNDSRHVELFYAVGGAGLVLHTLNPRLAPEQIAWICNDGGATLLFAAPEFAPLLDGLAAGLEHVRQVVWLTDAAHRPQGNSALATAANDYESLLAAESPDFDWPAIDEREANALCHTSGTTGNPKGVLYSHRSTVLHAMAGSIADVIGMRATDTVLPVVPMFHVNAWGVPFIALLNGARLVLPGRGAGDPATLATLINGERVTLALGVPTVWLALLQHLEKTATTLPSLARTIVGGAACPPAIMDEFREKHGVETLHAWGMTEMSPIGTMNAPMPGEEKLDDAGRRARRAKQGRAVFGVDLRIVGDGGAELPWDGRAFGALQVRGPYIAAGYYGHDTSPAHASGWFDTGDVATIDPDGFVQITDRTKDVIKSGGEWISSIELENHAVGHPAVAEAAVIGVPHPKWSERPLLLAVLKSGQTVSREELLAHVAGRVARWCVPDDAVFVGEIPHTSTGKINKLALRERYRDHYAKESPT
ncbi:MAG: long-chain-fatty-acid--CoA ligase [Gammaproteobacteria bacterium]|nr:long-chain-fatty-acid--CoA ligase [Gammaproteobacteria bacterium]